MHQYLEEEEAFPEFLVELKVAVLIQEHSFLEEVDLEQPSEVGQLIMLF